MLYTHPWVLSVYPAKTCNLNIYEGNLNQEGRSEPTKQRSLVLTGVIQAWVQRCLLVSLVNRNNKAYPMHTNGENSFGFGTDDNYW